MTKTHADWPLTTIGAEFEIQQGKSLSPNSRRGVKPRPFLRTSNVLWGRVDLSTVDQRDFTDEEFSRLSLVDGDLLVCEGGDIGRAAVYHGPSGHFAYQNHLHRLRAKTDEIIPDFVVHWLRAAFTQLGLYEGVGNKTTIPNLSRARLSQLQIPKPDPEEQRQVAGILGSVQRAIQVEAAICEKLATLKSATMAKLFREGLRGEPLKQTEIGEIPESWEVARLGDIARIGNGSTPKRTNEAYWKDGHIPWITSTKIHDVVITGADEFVTEDALRECHLPMVPRKSLVVAITGQGKTLGNVALLEIDTCINQHLAYVQFQNPSARPEFYLFFLQSLYPFFRQVSSAGGSTKGALTCGLIANLKVPFPSREEQQQIAELLLLLTRRHMIATKRSEALSTLFGAALTQLMTGGIRIKDLDVAEVSHA